MTYRDFVISVSNPNLTTEQQFANAALGLCGEAGEFADQIKKWQMQGHEFDREKLLKEASDIRWYLEYACNILGTSVAELEVVNMNKLRSRYPNGFSAQASVERKA